MQVSLLVFSPVNILPAEKEEKLSVSTSSTFSETWTPVRLLLGSRQVSTASPQGITGSTLAQGSGDGGSSLGSAPEQLRDLGQVSGR